MKPEIPGAAGSIQMLDPTFKKNGLADILNALQNDQNLGLTLNHPLNAYLVYIYMLCLCICISVCRAIIKKK